MPGTRRGAEIGIEELMLRKPRNHAIFTLLMKTALDGAARVTGMGGAIG